MGKNPHVEAAPTEPRAALMLNGSSQHLCMMQVVMHRDLGDAWVNIPTDVAEPLV